MNRERFRAMKHGIFVHYVPRFTCRADGSIPATADELADEFDAEGFARDLESFGVEYVIFTAWHFNVVCLYPSPAIDKWLPGHSVRRDLIGDMIGAVKSRGIEVLLYTHPRDGHDFSEADAIATGWGANGKTHVPNPNPATYDHARWNNFINDIYAEVVERYGNDILGLYLDEGSARGDSDRILDYDRLRHTIRQRHPELFMVQNYYGNLYTCDIGDLEYCHWREFESSDGSLWPSNTMPVASVISHNWMAQTAAGTCTTRFSPEDLFRYTVLQAGTCLDGGGVQWSAGPYAGGGWETGVAETWARIAELIAPVASSIKNTLPSRAYPTQPGSTVGSIAWGVATRSVDGSREYLHVLKAPDGKELALPQPAGGIRFSAARLLRNGRAADLVQNEQGLRVRLKPGDDWDKLDTVLELTIVL